MTAITRPAGRVFGVSAQDLLPVALTVVFFALLFAHPFRLLVRDWWNDPEAGHGLLLAPIAVWSAWRTGLRPDLRPNPVLGATILTGAILLRYVAGLAAELFTMRFSIVLALVGITVFFCGVRQVVRWWLPFALLALSIPLPALITNALALPLQFKASSMGAALLEWRNVPVRLSGNVILLPGRQLFVTEACSGLRSLTALLSLGLLIGGFWLKHPVARALVVVAAIPVAILINAVRVFLTGFLVYFVDPELGEGFMHMTEGWLLFVVAFAILGAVAWAIGLAEQRFRRSDDVARA